MTLSTAQNVRRASPRFAAYAALAALGIALTLVAVALLLIHFSGGNVQDVWKSFLTTLGPQFGALLAFVVVSFVGILFAFALGWMAVQLLAVLAIETLRLVTKPITDTVATIQGASGAVARAGGNAVQGVKDGAAAVGGRAADAGRAMYGAVGNAMQCIAPGGGPVPPTEFEK